MRFHRAFLQKAPNGFLYFNNFVSKEEKQTLQQIIDDHSWDQSIRRRQQHYGVTYYQTSHRLSTLQPADPLSKPAHNLGLFQFVIDRLIAYGLFSAELPPNQCLVNEYLKSNQLCVHVEDKECFGEVICGLSLKGPDWLRLQHSTTKE